MSIANSHKKFYSLMKLITFIILFALSRGSKDPPTLDPTMPVELPMSYGTESGSIIDQIE